MTLFINYITRSSTEVYKFCPTLGITKEKESLNDAGRLLSLVEVVTGNSVIYIFCKAHVIDVIFNHVFMAEFIIICHLKVSIKVTLVSTLCCVY